LHTETLEELSQDFDDTVKPMVVEIQGTQHRLTGTAEAQYEEWRQLLRQIFVEESGFVQEDVAIYTEEEPAPEAPVELPPVPELAAPALDATPAAGDGTEAEATTQVAGEEATTEAADADTSAGDGV
jgi:hypothetical protein